MNAPANFDSLIPCPMTMTGPIAGRRPAWLSRRALALWSLLSVLVLFIALGNPPVQRTQEARVLETAREMLSANWRQWLIPQLNGELRLRKPPLTYWLAASAFKIGGVSELTGRIPTVLIGWLTAILTYLIATQLFGRRTGFFSAGMLVASYLFFRHVRLAETDAPAMLFVTGAIYAFLRAAGGPEDRTSILPVAESVRTGWLYVAALATALAFLAKGGPGIFPLLFFPSFALVTHRWDVFRRFFTSGAVIVLLIVGASWYGYAIAMSGLKQFAGELRALSSGEEHGGSLLLYFPQVLLATAPWTGFVVAGIIEAVVLCRHQPRASIMLIWVAATFVPLWFTGNKQFHYLMPLMPPLMILAGWTMDAACGTVVRPAFRGAAAGVLRGTILAACVTVLAPPLVARLQLGRVRSCDLALSGILLSLLVIAAACRFFLGSIAMRIALVTSVAAALLLLTGFWFPTFRPHDPRTVAREIRLVSPQGPYCFYGGNISLPLTFNLRTQIPWVKSREQLNGLASRNAGLTVIAQTKDNRAAPQLDAEIGALRFVRQARVLGEEQAFDIYRVQKLP